MVKDAEAHAAEDKKRRDVIEQRNRLDNMVTRCKRSPKTGLRSSSRGSNRGSTLRFNLHNRPCVAETLTKSAKRWTSCSRHIQRRRVIVRRAWDGRCGRTGGAAQGGGWRRWQPGAEAKKDDKVVDADYEIMDDDKSKKS